MTIPTACAMQVAIRLKRPGAAFGPLAAAIELVQVASHNLPHANNLRCLQCGSATTLTPAHTALVQVALKVLFLPRFELSPHFRDGATMLHSLTSKHLQSLNAPRLQAH